MEFLDKNGLRVLWAQINNLVSSSGGGSSITLPLVNLQKIAEFPYSSTFTDEQANTLENQVASAIGFTYDDGIEYHVTCYLVKYDSLHNQYKWRYEDSSVVFEIVSVLSRTTGNVWASKNFTITKSVPSSGGGETTSDIPVLDLGEVSSMGSSINLTSDQVSWINANYNKINLIKFSDATEAGGTLPLLISTGSYQERIFYYGGVYGTTIYHAYLDMDNYSGAATSGTYYIQKANIDSASGGGSGSEPVEQETMFSGQYNNWSSGDSSAASLYLDTSSAGLTHSKIESFEFTFSLHNTYTSETETTIFQISVDDLYRMYQSGNHGMSILGGRFNLGLATDLSLSYDKGTFNYSITIEFTPNWSELYGYDYASVSTGFTYRGFKFANGNTY